MGCNDKPCAKSRLNFVSEGNALAASEECNDGAQYSAVTPIPLAAGATGGTLSDIYTFLTGYQKGSTVFTQAASQPASGEAQGAIVINAQTGVVTYTPTAAEVAAALASSPFGGSITVSKNYECRTSDSCAYLSSTVLEFTVTSLDPCFGKAVAGAAFFTTCPDLPEYDASQMDLTIANFQAGMVDPISVQVVSNGGTDGTAGTHTEVSPGVWRYYPTVDEAGRSVNATFILTDAEGCTISGPVTWHVANFCSQFGADDLNLAGTSHPDLFATGNLHAFVTGQTSFVQTGFDPANPMQGQLSITSAGALLYIPTASEQAAADAAGSYQACGIIRITDARCGCVVDGWKLCLTVVGQMVDPCAGRSTTDDTGTASCSSIPGEPTTTIDLNDNAIGYTSPVFTLVACSSLPPGTIQASGQVVNTGPGLYTYEPAGSESGQSVALCFLVEESGSGDCPDLITITLAVTDFCARFALKAGGDITNVTNSNVSPGVWRLRFPSSEIFPAGHGYDLSVLSFTAATEDVTFQGELTYDSGADEFVYEYTENEVCEFANIAITVNNPCGCPSPTINIRLHPPGDEVSCDLVFDGGLCGEVPVGGCPCPQFLLSYDGAASTPIETEMLAAAFNSPQNTDPATTDGATEIADQFIRRYDLVPSGGRFLVFIKGLRNPSSQLTGWQLESRLYDASNKLIGRGEYANDTGLQIDCSDELALGVSGPNTFNGHANETDFVDSTAVINP